MTLRMIISKWLCSWSPRTQYVWLFTFSQDECQPLVKGMKSWHVESVKTVPLTIYQEPQLDWPTDPTHNPSHSFKTPHLHAERTDQPVYQFSHNPKPTKLTFLDFFRFLIVTTTPSKVKYTITRQSDSQGEIFFWLLRVPADHRCLCLIESNNNIFSRWFPQRSMFRS